MTRPLQSFELHFKDHKDHDNAVIIDKEPDTCPVCEHGIEALFIDAYGRTDLQRGHFIQTIFKCPRIECQAVFLAFYTSPSWFTSRSYSENVYLSKVLIRSYWKEDKFDEEIENLSPDFVRIYTQSSIAESQGLNEICGPGYRKSLEFLIKDYLKLTQPDIFSEIEKHQLGYVIAHYIDDERIKNMAGLAKDIGNDETHYIKKIEALSIEDMKKLIRLTSHWIVTELLTDKYSEIYKKLMQK